MSKLGTISRRTFLIASSAIAGGVAFGTYNYKKPIANPLLDGLGDGEAGLTPFVKIDQQGVTLITPRADKGQGAYSIQAFLLAEELDVDPHKVRTSPGKPDKAYYNGAVLDEGAPGLGDIVGKLMGMQMTGGSSTVPDMYDRLRQAGAIARETLKLAASNKYGFDVASLKTQDGAVLMPDGTSASYVSLASDAAALEPVQDVALRPAYQWKYLGKPQQRIDILAKSTGTQDYGIDLSFPNMLHATVRANPGMGGAVTSYDDTEAKAQRGIKSIFGITSGVAVVADNTWRAFKAANLLKIDWAAPNYPKTSAEMWTVLEDNLVDSSHNLTRRDEGDAEQALESGDVIDAEYRTPHLAHAPMEPMNAVVHLTDTQIDLWTGTQIPRFVENHIKAMTGLSIENIHVHVQPMGGSFGHRLEDNYVLQAVEIAMQMKGQAIKMTWSREEDMTHDYPRPMTMARGQGKVANGQVDTFEMKLVAPSIIASWFGRVDTPLPGPDATITTGADDQPFDIANYRVAGYKSPEMVPVSSWRSVGASQNGFYHECFLDELISAAGADALEERIRLCNDDITRKVLEEVGKLANWSGSKLGANQGRGLAFTRSFGVNVAEIVDVTNTDRGIRIDNVYIACDVGQILDPINCEAQLTGGVIWALGHAMNCELTYENYAAQQNNFHMYQGLRMYQTPNIQTSILENADAIRGLGEPAVPPTAPALANAIFAATGKRIREMPLNKHIKFA